MSLFFAFPGFEKLATNLSSLLNIEVGDATIRHFPDGESFVQISSEVKNKHIFVLCGLEHPDQKAMALLFFSKTAKEMGAASIGLISPYLGYMRQDKRFHQGESITSTIFAEFLSCHFDWLITVDPHLHRHKTLSEIYHIPAIALHATDTISDWIKHNITQAVLIGPDEESEQWVADVAQKAALPFTVLRKIRHGDTNVEVSVPDINRYLNHTPVLIDDIISTGSTMIETIKHLQNAGMRPPVCIGVHAIFADDAYENLIHSGAEKIITCNTITHDSNSIDISKLLASEVTNMFKSYSSKQQDAE